MLGIDDLLLLPAKAFVGIFKQIHEMAKKEMDDERYALEKFMELELRYEMDEISREEYEKEQAKLQARLNAIREADDE